MNDLLTFKRNAVMFGLCGEYKARWDAATSKEDLMNIVLDANGVEFLCDSFAFGWGLDVEYFKRTFADYINGKWKRQGEYTSRLYIGYKGQITEDSTITVVIASEVEFFVPKGHICRLYVSGGSTVNIIGEGECCVYSYGDNNIKGRYKRKHYITKSEWVK